MILICKRASGELQTTATWIREFVQKHPAYKHDSVVSQEIAHDLVMEIRAIGEVGAEQSGSYYQVCRLTIPIVSCMFQEIRCRLCTRWGLRGDRYSA